MDSSTRELYQEVILDHNKNPRNFCEIEPANRTVDGFNPLCGDKYTLRLYVENDKIKNIGFTGTGCAISKSSASIMTTLVKNKSIDEAETLFRRFHDLVTGQSNLSDEDLGKLAVFKQVCNYPSRIKCAGLCWHTLTAALQNKEESVTTE